MQNHSTLRELWRFLRPESEELIGYTLVILIMLGLALYHVAVQGQGGADSQSLLATMASARDTLFDYFNQDDKWGRFFLFGFWFMIGTVVYILSWALVTFIIDINRDIQVSSSFAHPRSFHSSDFWLAIVTRFVLRATAGIALVFYSVFWLTGFAPVWLDSFEALFSGLMSLGHITNALVAFLSIAVTLHIAAVLLRITLLKSHYSYDT